MLGRGRYQCSLCDRSYGRSDVLTRHMSNSHGQSPPPMGRPRKTGCDNCISSKITCRGSAPETCPRCAEERLSCRYGKRRRISATTSSPSPTPASSASMLPPPVSQPLDKGKGIERVFGLEQQEGDGNTSYISLPSNAQTNTGPEGSLDTDNWISLMGMDPMENSMFDWGMMDSDRSIFDVLNTHAPNSPTLNFFPSTANPFVHQASPQKSDRSPEQLHGIPSEIPDGQPFDSLWPHIDKPRTPDSQLLLPNTIPAPQQTLFAGDRLSDKTRQTMLDLISLCHESIWPNVDTANFPSTTTLTVCINLYYRHFHHWLPILDRSTNNMEESVPLVVMITAAIGAMYSRDGLQRLGVAMSELVRRAIYYIRRLIIQRESDRRFIFETQIVQALLLQTQFSFYSGSQKAFQQAEVSRSVLVQACKRMHLLRPGRSAVRTLLDGREHPSTEDLFLAEQEDDRRSRLGWGIYLLDTQLACLLNLPAQLSVNEVTVQFPTIKNHSGKVATFAEIIDGFLTHGNHPGVTDEMGYSIVSHSLYRLCLDAAALQSIHVPSSLALFSKYNLTFASHIKHHPQELLDQIRAYTMDSHLPPTPLLISCAALANHSHLQFSILGFIEAVKAAAGKGGTAESRSIARQKVISWVNMDFARTRNIYANAAMLSCLLVRHTFDTPVEVIWTFDSALCLWAITRFSITPIADGPPVATISWSDSPQIDAWITHGGGISVQGLGDISTLSHGAILRYFMERLGNLSWGLAQQYVQILDKLLTED